MQFKKVLWAAAGCAALWMPAAHAQNTYPQKPVDVIVPWGAGGGADVMARILAKWLESDLKVSFPVLNVPGASGMIGLGKMVSLPADGQTIAVLTGDSLMMAATPKATFNLSDSLALAVLLRQPSGIFAPKNSRFKTWEDVVKNSDKEQVTLGITGPNTADDLTARYLKTRGVSLTGIPYTKPGERYSAVIGGHVDLLYEQAGDVRSFLESGDLRPLIFFSPKRLPPPFADVPASSEFGYEVLLPQVRAVLIKAGTDPQKIQRLGESIERFKRNPEYLKFVEQQLALPDSYMDGPTAQPFLLSELGALKKLLVTYGEK